MSDKLNWKDRGDLVVEAAVASIPYVGAALQTAYFGSKNEKRFKRIESFYNELNSDVSKLKSKMATSDQLQSISDNLSDFMEATNNIIESQSSLAKRSMLHNAFLTVLTSPSQIDWSETRFFMTTVNQIDLIDLQIMLALEKMPADKWATIKAIEDGSKLDHFYTVGLTERLVNFGYVEKRLGNISMLDDGTVIDTFFRTTELGSHFLSFTMRPPVPDDSKDD